MLILRTIFAQPLDYEFGAKTYKVSVEILNPILEETGSQGEEGLKRVFYDYN